LLDIDFQKRETFAYVCEAYAGVLARGERPADRRALAEEYSQIVPISDERVDAAEVASIVWAAATARNGWKVTLERRAPMRRLVANLGSE
jgi:hypothetical protein